MRHARTSRQTRATLPSGVLPLTRYWKLKRKSSRETGPTSLISPTPRENQKVIVSSRVFLRTRRHKSARRNGDRFVDRFHAPALVDPSLPGGAASVRDREVIVPDRAGDQTFRPSVDAQPKRIVGVVAVLRIASQCSVAHHAIAEITILRSACEPLGLETVGVAVGVITADAFERFAVLHHLRRRDRARRSRKIQRHARRHPRRSRHSRRAASPHPYTPRAPRSQTTPRGAYRSASHDRRALMKSSSSAQAQKGRGTLIRRRTPKYAAPGCCSRRQNVELFQRRSRPRLVFRRKRWRPSRVTWPTLRSTVISKRGSSGSWRSQNGCDRPRISACRRGRRSPVDLKPRGSGCWSLRFASLRRGGKRSRR